jgi:hypothetical protein
MVLAEASGFDEAFGAAALGATALAAGAASATTAAAALVVAFALAATSLTLSTMGWAAFTALVVPVIFVAFVTFAAFAGLATARRLAAIVLRSVGRAVLLRAASAFWALAVFFFRISTIVVFLWFKFLRAAALLFGVSVRAVLLALFEALLPVALRASLVRPPVGRSAAPLRRAEIVAALAMVRFACGRAAEAPDLRDLDLALVRAPAPAFDFFELFLRDAIRTSLLPRSAQQAEHATGDAIHSVASSRSAIGNHQPSGAWSAAE